MESTPLETSGSMAVRAESPAIPRWQCQSCRVPLQVNISSEMAAPEDTSPPTSSSSAALSASRVGASASSNSLDQSYVVLPPNHKPSGSGREPALPVQQQRHSSVVPQTAAQDLSKARVPTAYPTTANAGERPGMPSVPRGNAPNLDESFVVLPPAPPSAATSAGAPSLRSSREGISVSGVPAERGLGNDMRGKKYSSRRAQQDHQSQAQGLSESGQSRSEPQAGPTPGEEREPTSLYKRLAALEKVFQLVSKEMEVSLPLCLECAGNACQEMDERCREAEADIAAYSAALESLRSEGAPAASQNSRERHEPTQLESGRADTEAEDKGEARPGRHSQDGMEPEAEAGGGGATAGCQVAGSHSGKGAVSQAVADEAGSSEGDGGVEEQEEDEEERRLQAELESLRRERTEVQGQLRELEGRKAELEKEEERYWEQVNELMYRVAEHQSSREAVLAKIEVTNAQLESLRNLNVLNDAFHIWHDNEFGTISNFRLGRLPSVPVEWSEINAAWGQACHLLHTLAKICGCPLSCQIVPMGSYPKIIHGKVQYELFGPVNLFWSARYDQAMVLFLKCLKELAEFANAKDRALSLPPDKCFQLPYKIQDDKVNDLTIKQSFNRDAAWTKALKYMLCDLKWVEVWVINRNQVHQHPSAPLTSP